MASPCFLGLDVGTQSLRAAVFDDRGNCLGYATASLATRHPQPAWAEQDPAEWWQAAVSAVPQALTKAGCDPKQILSMGLDTTACTVVACAEDGTPLRPALLWMDQRAHREAAAINATKDPILKYVSGAVSPEWMLPKAMWLKKNEPRVYQTAHRIVECTDWMMHQLTGEWTLAQNHVAVKWNYVKPEGGWSSSLMRAVGLEDILEKWPKRIIPLGGGEAKLTAQAAAQLGLPVGLPIAHGGIDAYLGMLGMGAAAPGDLAMIVGSSTCHLAMSEKGLFGSGMGGCYPDAVQDGTFTLEGGQTATGSIVNWYREHFAGNEAAEAGRSGRNIYEILDAKAAAAPPGCDGLVCLENWQGNRSPHKNPHARGVFCGLTLAHGPGHIFRSIYEATALGTRAILEDLASHGFELKRIFVGGGGARSPLWLQIHADVLQSPIHVPAESEACVLGSALVAAVHAGRFASLSDAASAMVRIEQVVQPNSGHRAVYDTCFERYQKTYQASRPLFEC